MVIVGLSCLYRMDRSPQYFRIHFRTDMEEVEGSYAKIDNNKTKQYMGITNGTKSVDMSRVSL